MRQTLKKLGSFIMTLVIVVAFIQNDTFEAKAANYGTGNPGANYDLQWTTDWIEATSPQNALNKSGHSNADYIKYEMSTSTCYHFFQNNILSRIGAGGTFTIPAYMSSDGEAHNFTAPTSNPYGYIVWTFSYKAVIVLTGQQDYSLTRCDVLGNKVDKWYAGSVNFVPVRSDGYWNLNPGTSVGTMPSGIGSWNESYLGGYGIHGGGLCGDGCNGALHWGNGSSCLKAAGEHTTTFYRLSGYRQKTYTVTFNSGSYSSGATQSLTNCIVNTNYNTKGALFSRVGYTQRGWSKNANGATKDYELNTGYVFSTTGGVTVNLYPYWEINYYNLSLKAGKGISSVSGAGSKAYKSTVNIGASVNPGYKWNNWTGTYTKIGQYTSFSMPAQNVSLTANAVPITYTLRLNGNNNWNISQGSYTQVLTYDTPASLINNKFSRPNKTVYNNIFYDRGYEFIGWGMNPAQKIPTYLNMQVVSNLTTTDGAIIDLYALWKKTITLTIDFQEGKFNNSTANQVSNYTMYNSELSHTFDIKQYYGSFQGGSAYANKGLNTKLTKTDTNGIQYRFLGYSLDKNATVPDTQFDVYSSSRTENYTIRDNTTLYAVWEPVLQMTVQLTAPQHSGTMQLTSAIPVTTTLGNFTIPSGTRSTDIPSSATASVNSATIGAKVTNKDLVTYAVSAKGASNIKFSTAVDSRVLDIYTHGNVSCIIKIPIIAEGSPQSCRGNFPIIAEPCLVFS